MSDELVLEEVEDPELVALKKKYEDDANLRFADLQAQNGDLTQKLVEYTEAVAENKKLKKDLAKLQVKYDHLVVSAQQVVSRIVKTSTGTAVYPDSDGYFDNLHELTREK